MDDAKKTKAQLIAELEELRNRVAADEIVNTGLNNMNADERKTLFKDMFEEMGYGVSIYEAINGGNDFIFILTRQAKK